MKAALNKMTAIVTLVLFLQSFCHPVLAQEFKKSYASSGYPDGPTTDQFEVTTESESSSAENSDAGTGCDPLCPATDDSTTSDETAENTSQEDDSVAEETNSTEDTSSDNSSSENTESESTNENENSSEESSDKSEENDLNEAPEEQEGESSDSQNDESRSDNQNASFEYVHESESSSDSAKGTSSDAPTNISGNTLEDFTPAHDNSYNDQSHYLETYVYSFHATTGTDYAEFKIDTYGNYSVSSNLILRITDSHRNILQETPLICNGSCYARVSGLSSNNSFYAELFSENSTSYVSGATSTAFQTSADYSNYYYSYQNDGNVQNASNESASSADITEGTSLNNTSSENTELKSSTDANQQPAQGQDANNNVENQAPAKPKPADKPDLDKVQVNFIKLKDGKINISATLAEARASINLYLEAGHTEAAGKLILELMSSRLMAAIEIHEYISKMINGYTTAAGNQVPEDIKTATALIVGSLGIRASTPAQVISYLDILLALGDANKLRVPFPDSAEEIIVAANNVPLLSLVQGKPSIVTANNVTLLSFTQIKPYIDHFMAAGDLDSATRIIVAAIPKLLPANLEIEIADYLDKFLARGEANKSRTPSPLHAEIILKTATTPPQRFRLVHVYVEEFIQQGQMEIATNLIIHTYNVGMLDAFGLRFTIDRFLALGWYSEDTIHMDAARALILEAIAKPNNLGAINVFTGEQIKIYLQILDSRNEVDTASDIAKSALAAGLITAAEAQAYTSRI